MMLVSHRFGGVCAIRSVLRWFVGNRVVHSGAAASRAIGVVRRGRWGLRHVLDGRRRCGCRLIVGFRRTGCGPWCEQAPGKAGVVGGRFRRHGFAFHTARRVHPADPCAQVRPCVRMHGDQVEVATSPDPGDMSWSMPGRICGLSRYGRRGALMAVPIRARG